ncbi:MAG: DUF3301 domain-containing protein, partial [Pseudomonadota bacterium]
LSYIPWLLLIALLMVYWWQSGSFKGRARELATRHCQQLGLQLLDQSMVIRGLWPRRTTDGRVGLRRTYHFEFASTGHHRYQGVLKLVGMRLESIELEAYQLPDVDS